IERTTHGTKLNLQKHDNSKYWVKLTQNRDRLNDRAQIIYYTNLLISNVIQFCARVYLMPRPEICYYDIAIAFYFISVMCLLLCFCVLAYIWLQIKRSLLVSALVWAFCIITVVPATVFEQFIIPPIFALLPAPLFIVCLAGTIKALRAATSVPTEEKRRTVGTLVLLLFNYCLIVIQIWIVWWLFPWVYVPSPFHCCFIETVVFSLFLLHPFLDLILFVFMQRGCIDKLLACLCCCRMDSTAAAVSTTSV
uniref:G-protein coupled receptors family 1 profile domain-containing protein n=1 Tax=Maylandia zebra TaxID=106582 RepID=A0A3P9DQJ7_9CICH